MDTNTVGGQRIDVSGITLGGQLLVREGGEGEAIVGDRTMRFEQTTPSARWVIEHPNFGKIPAIHVVTLHDETEDEAILFGVESSTANRTIITFNPPFAGIAILS